MPLTPDQRALWTDLGMNEPPRPSGEQTPAQAINLAVDSFRFLCRLDGLPVPAEAEVRAEALWSVS